MQPCVTAITRLTETIQTPTLFTGDGVAVYKDTIIEQLADHAVFAPAQLIFPRAAATGTLALNKFKAEQFLDPASAAPLYIRPSDAEVNLKKARRPTSQK
jgi:tRNA threonylcarbamoyladenosine biosynthesis protein TsaB